MQSSKLALKEEKDNKIDLNKDEDEIEEGEEVEDDEEGDEEEEEEGEEEEEEKKDKNLGKEQEKEKQQKQNPVKEIEPTSNQTPSNTPNEVNSNPPPNEPELKHDIPRKPSIQPSESYDVTPSEIESNIKKTPKSKEINSKETKKVVNVAELNPLTTSVVANSCDRLKEASLNLVNDISSNDSEQIIKPGLVLIKTKEEALIAHSDVQLECKDVSPSTLMDSLKDKDKRTAIYINISDLENRYLKKGLIEESGEINKDDIPKMQLEVAKRHPGKMKDKTYEKLDFIKSKIGFLCCLGKVSSSDFDNMGIGIVMYFKLLKTFIITFFFVSLLSAVLAFIYFKNTKIKIPIHFLDVFSRLALGNIPNSHYNCKVLPSQFFQDSTNTLEFDCGELLIFNIIQFGTSQEGLESYNNENCYDFMVSEYLKVNTSTNNKKLANEIETEFLKSGCIGKKSCTITPNYYQISMINPKFFEESDYFYLSYSCYSPDVETGLKPFKRKTFAYFTVIMDIVMTFMIYITLKIIKCYKEKNEKKFINERTFIRDFTLHLTGLKIKKVDLRKEFDDLIKHFVNVAQVEKVDDFLFNFDDITLEKKGRYADYMKSEEISLFNSKDYFIFDLVYPILNASTISQVRKFNKLKEKIVSIDEYNKAKGKNQKSEIPPKLFELDEDLIDINEKKDVKQNVNTVKDKNQVVLFKKSAQTISNAAIPETLVEPKEDKGNNTKLDELREKCINKMDEIKADIHTKSNDDVIDEIYIIFRNYRIANFYNKLYSLSPIKRCIKRKKIGHLYYKEKWLNLSFARDEPTSIKWENRKYTTFGRFWRSLLIIFLAFLLLCISIIGLVFAKKYQRATEGVYNTNIDCTHVENYHNEALVYQEQKSGLSLKSMKLSYCYCYDVLTALNVIKGKVKKFPITSGGDTVYPCEKFFNSYGSSSLYTVGLIILIPIINSLMVFLIKSLTFFQKNKTLSDDLSSNLWKMFLVQFINTGLLLVIINTKVESVTKKIPKFPIFAGDFKDMDPEWYRSVGSILFALTLVNILIPHLYSLVISIYVYIRRCYDSGTKCMGDKTKKLLKKDYFDLYTGPVFEMDNRYATILTNLYVTLFFSSAMPLLNVTFWGFLVLLFIFDKLLVVRFYRTPPKFDLKILEQFLTIAVVGIFFHFLMAIWIYGNPHILVSLETSADFISSGAKYIKQFLLFKESFANNIVERLTMSHNIFLLIIVIIFILIFLCQIFLVNIVKFFITLFSLFCFCCKKKKPYNKKAEESEPNIEIGLGLPLKDLYKYYQIKKIEYFNLMKSYGNLDSLLYNGRCGIQYSKSFMIYKILLDYKGNKEELINNFDKTVEKEKHILESETNHVMEGDASYNLAFVPEYESVSYYEYLKNI